MSVLTEIAAQWQAPRAAIRGRLDDGVREDRALARLAGGCIALFIAQWPAIFRAAAEDPSVPVEARLGGALLAILFLAPLVFYALAAVSHLIAKVFGGQGTFYGARLALFSALFAVSPLVLTHGIVAGIAGPGAIAAGVGILVLAAFLWLWVAGLLAVEGKRA